MLFYNKFFYNFSCILVYCSASNYYFLIENCKYGLKFYLRTNTNALHTKYERFHRDLLFSYKVKKRTLANFFEVLFCSSQMRYTTLKAILSRSQNHTQLVRLDIDTQISSTSQINGKNASDFLVIIVVGIWKSGPCFPFPHCIFFVYCC